MLNQRRTAQENKVDQLAEYKAKFSEDLMARLQQKGQMHDRQRRSWMQKKQNFREKVAACSPDGKKITFVKPLEDMERADYEAA